MKNTLKILIFLSITSVFAYEKNHDDYNFSKEKKISKTYNSSKDVLSNISNSYGNVNVYLWDEDKVSIEVNIKISGDNENKVQKRLEGINIDFDTSINDVIAAKTVLEENNWGNNMRNEINYIVKIPKNGSIKIKNKYGNITIDQLNGSASINSQYGSVLLGYLSNETNDINISYSKNSKIESINKLNLNSQYSDLEISKANIVKINGNYNKFNFQNIGNCSMESNYSNLNINKVQKINIDGNYLTISVKNIQKSVDIESNYTKTDLTLNDSVDFINVNGNYSHTKINGLENLIFSFDINLSYGSFKDEIGLKYTEKYEKNQNKNYKGYHKSQSKNSINIQTNYGSVQLLN